MKFGSVLQKWFICPVIFLLWIAWVYMRPCSTESIWTPALVMLQWFWLRWMASLADNSMSAGVCEINWWSTDSFWSLSNCTVKCCSPLIEHKAIWTKTILGQPQDPSIFFFFFSLSWSGENSLGFELNVEVRLLCRLGNPEWGRKEG